MQRAWRTPRRQGSLNKCVWLTCGTIEYEVACTGHVQSTIDDVLEFKGEVDMCLCT